MVRHGTGYTFFAIAGILLLGVTASAQRRDRYDENQYGRGGRETLNHVRAELNRLAPRIAYLPGFELRRFDTVRERLGALQRKWERGRFDMEDLNAATHGLRELIDRAPLRPRDRAVLEDNLRQLHEIRARYERHT